MLISLTQGCRAFNKGRPSSSNKRKKNIYSVKCVGLRFSSIKTRRYYVHRTATNCKHTIQTTVVACATTKMTATSVTKNIVWSYGTRQHVRASAEKHRNALPVSASITTLAGVLTFFFLSLTTVLAKPRLTDNNEEIR